MRKAQAHQTPTGTSRAGWSLVSLCLAHVNRAKAIRPNWPKLGQFGLLPAFGRTSCASGATVMVAWLLSLALAHVISYLFGRRKF